MAVANSSVIAQLHDSVDSRQTELMSCLADVVRIPTITGAEDLAEGFFRDWFSERHWQFDTQILAETQVGRSERGIREPRMNERANLVGWYDHPSGKPIVTINAHYDVVPIIDEADWIDDPFSGISRDGAVFGRGAVDNKAGCVTALYALQALSDSNVTLNFDLAVELIAGEETTGLGTVATLEVRGDRLATIVMEPTMNAVVPTNSGILFFTIEVTGRAVHTSLPWRGEDALAKLISIYQALHELGDHRSSTQRHPLMQQYPSSVPLVIGTLSGGGWRAAVPAHATMSGRIGVLPGESLNDVRRQLVSVVESVADGDSWLRANPPRIRWDSDGLPGWELPSSSSLVTAFIEGQRLAGAAEKVEGMTAGCDAGILRRAGIATIVFGPGDLARAHSPNEYVFEEEVTEATKILAGALLALSDLVGRGDLP